MFSLLLTAVFSMQASAMLPQSHSTSPATPVAVENVVSIQPFELEAPAKHLWRVEQPMVTSGYLLVLKVDPALVVPRQVAEPVLYVGHQTAERVNVGSESGHVIAILPAQIDPEKPDYLDLSEQLFWFGSPELPERVDAKRIAAEHQEAIAAGIRPFGAEKIATAMARGGLVNEKASKRDLIHDAMRRLVREYSPQERSLVEGVLKSRPAKRR